MVKVVMYQEMRLWPLLLPLATIKVMLLRQFVKYFQQVQAQVRTQRYFLSLLLKRCSDQFK